jgi:integrase
MFAPNRGYTVTLRKVWEDYKVTRKLKPITIRNYDQRLNSHLSDWLDLPITEITKNMVEERHRHIEGNAMANSTFRTLRALLHYAALKYEDDGGEPVIKNNPVRRLSEVRAWRKDKRRKTIIRPTDLTPWMKAVFSLENSTTRDLMLTILFTGMRKTEATSLTWNDINLDAGTIMIRAPKNGEDIEIPMPTYLWNLLAIRSHGAGRSQWVFPGKDPSRPISAGHKGIMTVIERSGVSFCMHDLRRTFITIADELDIKSEVVKALVNHKSDDVTEGYTIRSIERLRRATEKISGAILHYSGMRRIRI